MSQVKKVGIMRGGSKNLHGDEIEELKSSLKADYTPQIEYHELYAADEQEGLAKLANRLLDLKIDLLIAAGGSRSAETAKTERGKRSPDTPTILFTSVAPYILDDLATNMTGVCAHTSDHEVDRLTWLTKMGLGGNRIGVLRNSNRKDHKKQLQDLQDAAGSTWEIHERDVNVHTVPAAFTWFEGRIDGLVVAADPFLNENREEIVKSAYKAGYPAIYQWREFVTAGGLMSYGPNLIKLYRKAGSMAAEILNGGIPGPWCVSYPDDFELVVKRSTAQHLKKFPLPDGVAAGNPDVIP
jgi:putative ABC transport system substrate-binding protein